MTKVVLRSADREVVEVVCDDLRARLPLDERHRVCASGAPLRARSRYVPRVGRPERGDQELPGSSTGVEELLIEVGTPLLRAAYKKAYGPVLTLGQGSWNPEADRDWVGRPEFGARGGEQKSGARRGQQRAHPARI